MANEYQTLYVNVGGQEPDVRELVIDAGNSMTGDITLVIKRTASIWTQDRIIDAVRNILNKLEEMEFPTTGVRDDQATAIPPYVPPPV